MKYLETPSTVIWGRCVTGPGQDSQHTAAPVYNGGRLTWQREREAQYNVVTCLVAADSVTEPFLVSESLACGDWGSEVGIGPYGAMCIARHSYDGHSHCVYARIRRDGNWSRLLPIAQTDAFEGKPTVVADRQGRFWIVWEEGGRNWGKKFTSLDFPMTE